MSLSAEEKAELKGRLDEAHVPIRSYDIPLSKCGTAGRELRAYLLSDYTSDALERRGLLAYPYRPGLAASYARDIALAGASVLFTYLQSFARLQQESMPQSYVIEWFEQDADTPFSGRERYAIETAISQSIEDGVIFYMFTSVHPDHSKWWSKQFMQMIKAHNRIIGVTVDGDRPSRQRTSIRNTETQGQENPRRRPRNTVR